MILELIVMEMLLLLLLSVIKLILVVINLLMLILLLLLMMLHLEMFATLLLQLLLNVALQYACRGYGVEINISAVINWYVIVLKESQSHNVAHVSIIMLELLSHKLWLQV